MGLAAAMFLLTACAGAALAYSCFRAAWKLWNRSSRTIPAAILLLLGAAGAVLALWMGSLTWECFHFWP